METLTISHWRRVSAFRRLDWEGALVSPSMRLIGRRHPLFPHPASVGRGLPEGVHRSGVMRRYEAVCVRPFAVRTAL
jgi:hypothetical protein